MSHAYAQLGASAHKEGVHKAIEGLDKGLFPGAFCKAVPDHLTGSTDHCLILHADGVGTKSALAYLMYKETGQTHWFRGLAQDSLIMNIDDLICMGTTGPFVFSNTIGRNSKTIPDVILPEIIGGYADVCANLAKHGIEVTACGGETADLADLTRTLVIDSTVFCRMKRNDVINAAHIKAGHAIVALASYGQATYEDAENSGIGSNGLTLARHALLSSHYRRYPESFAPEVAEHVYRGSYQLSDPLPFTSLTIGQALLSPTRSFAPVVKPLLALYKNALSGILHCSGGGLTKCLHFGNNIHYIKNNLIPLPPIFSTIQESAGLSVEDMVATFNCGSRLEIYCEQAVVDDVVALAKSFGIHAQQIGVTAPADQGRKLSLTIGDKTLEMTR